MITHLESENVRFYSQVANSLGNSCKFCFYLRMIDVRGSGIVKFHIMDCLANLNISKSTFYLYLNKSSIVRNYSVKDGVYIVHYRAMAKLAVVRGLTSLGAIAKVNFQKDIVSNWRQTVHLMEALLLQKQSKAKATQTEKENGKKMIAQPRVIMDLDAVFDKVHKVRIGDYDFPIIDVEANQYIKVEGCDDFPIYRGVAYRPFSIFINSQYVATFGGAQDTIADRLDVSSRTTRRHLANVSKIRQAKSCNDTTKAADYQRFISSEDHSNIKGKYFNYNLYESSYREKDREAAKAIRKDKTEVWANTVCLYEEVFQLESVRWLRSTVRRIAQGSAIEDLIQGSAIEDLIQGSTVPDSFPILRVV
jgi:hypothetical protein